MKIFKSASGNTKSADAIETKYAKYQKKKKKWEKKTWEAKKFQILAERNYEKAYKTISEVYSDLLSEASFYYDKDKREALALNSEAGEKFDKYGLLGFI